MTEPQEAQQGAWPWGKGKETHQQQAKSDDKKSGSAHDDAKSNTSKSAKDVPRSSDSQAPIRLKDDEADQQSEHYTTEPAKSAAPSKNTHMTNGVNGEDKKSEAPSKSNKSAKDDDKESSVNNPLNELKAGLAAGEDDKSKPDDSGKLKEVDPAPLTDEEKKRLTPGDGLKEPEISAEPEKIQEDDKDVKSQVSAKKDDAADKADDTADDAKGAVDDVKPSDDVTSNADDATKPADDNISTEEVKPDDSISRVEDAKSEVKPDQETSDLKEGVKTTEEDAKSEAKPDKAASDVKEGVEATAEDAKSEVKPDQATDDVKEGVETTEEDVKSQAKPEDAASDLKEGVKTTEENAEDVTKEGEDTAENATKEGEEATKDVSDEAQPETENLASDNKEDAQEVTDEATKEADDNLKEGEEATKDLADDATKEGEAGDDALKEGEEATKDATDDTVKEGEEAAKDATDEATEEADKVDFSVLRNGKVNKGGNVVIDGKVVGRVTEGILAQLIGKRVDEEGNIWNDSGKKVGRAEPIPDDEREGLSKATGPFEAFTDAKVDGEGYVISNGERVGKVTEGDIKSLRGMSVDPDGDILSRSGDVIGKAERWEPEPEPEKEPEPEVDRSILAGKRVNKAGNVVDGSGVIFGRVVEGDVKRMVGRMCDKKGNILSESGDHLGRAEVVPEGEREGVKEGPFAELSGCTVTKEGTVVTPGGDVVGRLVKGDAKVLFGRLVDEDGDILDKNGNSLGKAERWEPEPAPEKKKGPMAGRRVNREGNVVDEDGNTIGRLTTGDLSICAGKEIDDDGDVVDGKGTTIGHCSLLQDIPAPKEEESPEDKEKREKAEQDKKLAQQMSYCLQQCLDKIQPICANITSKIEKAERTPKEELDEEQLVREVRPLIEQGGAILTESNGIIRGLDPDGRIQRNAKHKAATHEATPEEHHLAEVLKELTGSVTQCIENAKKKLEGMPHAKKELSPLWGLLSEPLFQILAAVGLLLNGVLGLVGRLLSGLGLGGLVDSLLGGLGVKNILQALGIGSLTDSLTGKNQKGGKKSGGLLGLGG